jgi:hypothetical protein
MTVDLYDRLMTLIGIGLAVLMLVLSVWWLASGGKP